MYAPQNYGYPHPMYMNPYDMAYGSFSYQYSGVPSEYMVMESSYPMRVPAATVPRSSAYPDQHGVHSPPQVSHAQSAVHVAQTQIPPPQMMYFQNSYSPFPISFSDGTSPICPPQYYSQTYE